MGWPEKTDDLKKFYPTSDLVTGPDIIFFWVARMIMAGYHFMGKKPFSNVYYTGIIRDSLGRKMSKSLGNSPDPLDLIDLYGADGVRFGLMLIAPQGQDILFTQERLEIGRNFCNKLWNATRFVLMNITDDARCTIHDARQPLSLADKWITNRLEHTVREVNAALDNYEFDNTARILYQFVWRDFCDWYLELSKVSMNCETLVSVLTSVLELLHPYMPFITEELWQQLKEQVKVEAKVKDVKSIMFEDYPAPSKQLPYEKEAVHLETVKKIIEAIRNVRGEHNIKPQQKIEATINIASDGEKGLIEDHRSYIEDLASLGKLAITKGAAKPEDVATALVEDMEIWVPWKGLIDAPAERARMAKEIARAEGEMEVVKNKLGNESFVSKAKPQVVAQQREKLGALEDKLAKLKDALNKLT
jgi:valyl-tRNA synthetase